jgi:4-hydroxybenzoate polyprenyltransferase
VEGRRAVSATAPLPVRGLLAKTALTLEMIKVAHSVFALPFALASLLIASHGRPGLRLLGLVVAAMVLARAAAMAFNRLVDARFDAKNPRTSGRALPAGRLSRGFAIGFVVACAALFIAVSASINSLCLALSPVALAVVLGYSYAKRFTALCHVWLGVALAISPLAAWIALIYACQDVEFDRREGLFSIPARLGPARALALARAFHVLTVAGLAGAGALARRGWPWWCAVAIAAGLLAWQHRIADPAQPRRLEIAFFRLNAAIGPLVLLAVIVEEALR